MLYTTMTAMMERLRGMTIFTKTVHLEAPSISAASSSSRGMLFSKKLRTMITLPTATTPGRNSAHILPSRPVCLTMR